MFWDPILGKFCVHFNSLPIKAGLLDSFLDNFSFIIWLFNFDYDWDYFRAKVNDDVFSIDLL